MEVDVEVQALGPPLNRRDGCRAGLLDAAEVEQLLRLPAQEVRRGVDVGVEYVRDERRIERNEEPQWWRYGERPVPDGRGADDALTKKRGPVQTPPLQTRGTPSSSAARQRDVPRERTPRARQTRVAAREVSAIPERLELADDELRDGAPSFFASNHVRIQVVGDDALENGPLRSARLA